jgi:hypothetical protein
VPGGKLFIILRWVIAPIAVAAITGYYETRVRGAKEQTRATYETLAPNVLELQEKVAVLTGRLEELSKRPSSTPCSEESKAPSKPAAKTHAGFGGLGGKTEVMVDRPDSPSLSKMPARFEDMLQQRAK